MPRTSTYQEQRDLDALRLNDREQRELTMLDVLRDLVSRIESGELAVLNFVMTSTAETYDGLSQDGRLLKLRSPNQGVKIEIEVEARKARDVRMPTIEDMGLGERPATKPAMMGARDLILDD